ncbi:thiamine pyrophosphate-binding protein [Streptomyces sp. 900105755]
MACPCPQGSAAVQLRHEEVAACAAGAAARLTGRLTACAGSGGPGDLAMARRADAQVTEVKAGHLSLVTRPDVVTRPIEEAAGSAGRPLGQTAHPARVTPSGPRTGAHRARSVRV